MKAYLKFSFYAFMVCALLSVATYADEIRGYLLKALAYAGYFFIAVTLLIALTWVGLGLRNLVKIYYDIWKAKREYKREDSNLTIRQEQTLFKSGNLFCECGIQFKPKEGKCMGCGKFIKE